MKYLFKYENVSHDGFVVSHRLFLTKEERHKLQTPGDSVQTVGVCVPVMVAGNDTNEPAREIFCRYNIVHADQPQKIVEMEDEGWTVYLAGHEQAHALDDIRDFRKNPGVEFLALARHDMITLDGVSHPITHQIVISDREVLDKSLYLVHLPHTSSR